jgi:hypothetical protein
MNDGMHPAPTSSSASDYSQGGLWLLAANKGGMMGWDGEKTARGGDDDQPQWLPAQQHLQLLPQATAHGVETGSSRDGDNENDWHKGQPGPRQGHEHDPAPPTSAVSNCSQGEWGCVRARTGTETWTETGTTDGMGG